MKRLTLLAVDIAVYYGALALTLLFRYGDGAWNAQYAAHLMPFTALFFVWLFAFYIANLYDWRVLRNDRDFFSRLIQALALAAVLSVLFFYFVPAIGITPKTNLFLFIGLFAVLASGVRTLANRILAAGTKKRVLVVGVNPQSLELASFVQANPQSGWTVRAMLPIGQEPLPLQETPALWTLLDERTDLVMFIRDHRIDTVVISPQAYGESGVVAALYRALGTQVDFVSLATFSEELTGTVPLGAISEQWFLENITEGSKKSFEVLKRGFDIVGAILLSIPVALLSPIIIAAIWLDSPGYPFLHQKRTGLGGKPFIIIKFRSMIPDAEKATGVVWTGKNDPRITRIGQFLRTTRIDELPQIWNILRGEMSFIGPRAERPEFDARLAAQVPFYHERYLIKPGLSGWAQINPPYYYASIRDAIEKLQYDLYYIKHRSLALDLEIVLKTINISLRRAGR